MLKPNEVKNIYDDFVGNKLQTSYQHDRWFKTPMLEAGFFMTDTTISHFLFKLNKEIDNIFELGPGGGTWSKKLLEFYSGAKLDMLDISQAMLTEAKDYVSVYSDRVSVNQGDFLEFNTDKKYDLFFSSRVIEYLDQEKAIKKVSSIIKSGGIGFIITKTPHYKRAKIIGRKLGKFHKGQIEPKKLKKLLLENGFSEVRSYPVITHVPFVNIVWLDRLVYLFFSKFQLHFISQFFSESYCVIFKKQ